MAQYLTFQSPTLIENMASFNQVNDSLDQIGGYTLQSGIKYADPIIHPDGIKVAIAIIAGAVPFITQSQKDSLIDKLPDGWITSDS